MESSRDFPKHIAIIMDGNGRWAKEKGLPRIEGHRKGMESIQEIVTVASELKLKYLTCYAFSKENWARPKTEIQFLMTLLSQYLDSEFKKMKSNGIRFNTIGKTEDLPEEIQEKIQRNVEETRDALGMCLTLALSYSSRVEIVEAVKQLCARVQSGQLSVDQVSEAEVSKALATSGMPDPDLLIRTSGEFRVSNFLLWQISYTELFVSDKYWPDFRKEEFMQAVRAYQKRERRFGRTEAMRVPNG